MLKIWDIYNYGALNWRYYYHLKVEEEARKQDKFIKLNGLNGTKITSHENPSRMQKAQEKFRIKKKYFKKKPYENHFRSNQAK